MATKKETPKDEPWRFPITLSELKTLLDGYFEEESHRKEITDAQERLYKNLLNDPIISAALEKEEKKDNGAAYHDLLKEASMFVILNQLATNLAFGYKYADIFPYLQAITDTKSIITLLNNDSTESDQKLNEIIKEAYKLRDGTAATRRAPLSSLIATLDKVSQTAFFPQNSEHGKEYPAKAESRTDKREINILYTLNYGGLTPGLSRNLTQFDKRVFDVITSYYYNGIRIFTATQVHYSMGNKSRPNPAQLKKIAASVSKLRTTELYINNEEERKNGYNYPPAKYSDTIVSIGTLEDPTGIRFIVKGEPILAFFARERKQLTTINAKALLVEASMTEEIITIQNYLFARIKRHKHDAGKMEKGKRPTPPCTVKLETLFEKIDITEKSKEQKDLVKKQKQRAREKLEKVLESLKNSGEISGFKFASGEKKDPIKKKPPTIDRVIIFFEP